MTTEPTQEARPIAVTPEMLTEALTEFRLSVWGGSREHNGPVADPALVADALHATLSRIVAERAPDDPPPSLPPGRYGRVEIPGYRENEGWICEETRFGQQVAVVRDREGNETAAVGIGPLCRVVWLPIPGTEPEPRLALTAGGSPWADEGTDDHDEMGTY